MILYIGFINDKGIETALYPSDKWITTFSGADPGEADVGMTSYAARDGAKKNGSRRGEKYIELTTRLFAPVEHNRHELYKAVPLNTEGRLLVTTEERSWYVDCTVKKVEVDIFTSKESVTVELAAEDPNHYAIGNEVTAFSSTEDVFEFDVTWPEEGLYLSITTAVTEGVINYEGETPIGVTISAHATGSVKGLKIYNQATQGYIGIDDTKLSNIVGTEGLVAGDTLVICTVKGKKSLILVRNGVEYNVINTINATPEWFELSYGENVFEYTADSGIENVTITFENQTAYLGA